MGLQIGGRMTDQMETVCSECRHGIFAGRPRVWSTDPLRLGLVHPECLPASTKPQPKDGSADV